MAPFDQSAYLRLLPASCSLGLRLEYRASVPSTMATARELLHAGESAVSLHGAVVLCDEQTAGIGRRGRSWEAEACCSLLFSLVWAPAAAGTKAVFPELVRLNLAAPVAVVGACSAVGVHSALVKWPNDVWAGRNPRKLSGVILDFDGSSAVLGVGINVLQDMSSHPAATSVSTLLAESPPPPPLSPSAASAAPHLRERLLSSFCVELDRLMRLDTPAVIAEHSRHDLLRGRTVRVHHRTREEVDERDFDAIALGLASDGTLRVRPLGGPAGREVCLSAQEISITPRLDGDR